MRSHVILLLIPLVLADTVPTPSVGPGGSTFSLIETWKDADLAAFVDVNSDRRTDALVYSTSTHKLETLMAPNAKQVGGRPQREDLVKLNITAPVVSVVAADFNGDSRVDYLVITETSPTAFTASVVFGHTMRK